MGIPFRFGSRGRATPSGSSAWTTPETKHPTEAVQYFGREASAFTKAALEGKTVLLQKDRTGDTVDRYGRWLRYVLLDGDNFNAG